MSDKAFLYFDEPTSGLDAANMRLVSETIGEQAASGKTAFVITHDYEFALSVFNSLLIVCEDRSIRRLPPGRYTPAILSEFFNLEEM